MRLPLACASSSTSLAGRGRSQVLLPRGVLAAAESSSSLLMMTSPRWPPVAAGVEGDDAVVALGGLALPLPLRCMSSRYPSSRSSRSTRAIMLAAAGCRATVAAMHVCIASCCLLMIV